MAFTGQEKSDQKAYTHEFKLEPGENITDVTVKSVEGVTEPTNSSVAVDDRHPGVLFGLHHTTSPAA